MNTLTLRLIFSALTAMALAACGGGSSGGGSASGPDSDTSSLSSSSSNSSSSSISSTSSVISSSSSSSSSSVDADTHTGVFLDSAVGGVKYSTPTQEGTTNSLGEFVYLEGEEVTFSIGGTSFPPVKAKEKVTPLDIGGDDADLGTTTVLNILRLLQTLDEDGDPENGITITAETINALLDVALDVTVGTFEDEATGQISEKTGKVLVSENAAVAHFEGTLRGDLLGSWLYEEDTGNINILTFLDDSTYVIAHSMADDGDQTAGSVEFGRYTWNPVSGEFSVTDVISETDASGGLYDSSAPANSQGISASVSAGTLTLQLDDGTAEFTAVSSPDYELSGAWYLGDHAADDHAVLTVFSPTDYVIVQTRNIEAYDGEAVVETSSEWSTYDWNATSGELQVGTPSVETDGPGGLYDASSPEQIKSFVILGNGDLGYRENVEEQAAEPGHDAEFLRLGGYGVELSDRDGDVQQAEIKRDVARSGNNYVGAWYFSDIGPGETGEFDRSGTGLFTKLMLEDNGAGTITYPPSEDNDFSENDTNSVTWSVTTSGTLRVTEVDGDGEQSLRSFTPVESKAGMGVLMRTIIESDNRLAEAFIINLYAGEPHKPNQFDHVWDFADGIEGWYVNNWDNVEHGNATLAYDAEQQAIRISPNWDATDGGDSRDVSYLFPEGELGALAGPERPDGTPVYFILTVPDYYMDTPENPRMSFGFTFSVEEPPYTQAGFGRWLHQAHPLGNNQYCFGNRMLDDPRLDPGADLNSLLALNVGFGRHELDTGGEAGPDILLNAIAIDRPPYLHNPCDNI